MDKLLCVKLKSYDHQLLDSSATRIFEAARMNNVQVIGPIPLPTKREIITIIQSPHKHKDSREQFERRTYKRLIKIIDFNENLIRELSNLPMPNGISIEIKGF